MLSMIVLFGTQSLLNECYKGSASFLRPLQSLTAHAGVMLEEGRSQTLIREDAAADDQSALQNFTLI